MIKIIKKYNKFIIYGMTFAIFYEIEKVHGGILSIIKPSTDNIFRIKLLLIQVLNYFLGRLIKI